ncbi:hypothetical protein GYA19_03285 [Candidatus Beckwithbacteria bacterium]|nr:hypothetical protein [Candidatus Beckwithbacteria bacterium]
MNLIINEFKITDPLVQKIIRDGVVELGLEAVLREIFKRRWIYLGISIDVENDNIEAMVADYLEHGKDFVIEKLRKQAYKKD